jgi:hypothetical protein
MPCVVKLALRVEDSGRCIASTWERRGQRKVTEMNDVAGRAL